MLIGFAVFFAACIFSLVALEVALRLVYPQMLESEQYDSVIGWQNRQNFQGLLRSNDGIDYVVTQHINSKGFRGGEVNGSAIKILVVGDSFAFGSGVQDTETFSYLLERDLRSKDFDVSVLNAGVKGYNVEQYYLYLKYKGLNYSPDLVIVSFFAGNDLENKNLVSMDLAEIPSGKPSFIFFIKRFLGMNSHAYAFFITKAMGIPAVDSVLIRVGFFSNHYTPFFAQDPVKFAQQGKKAVLLLQEMERLSGKKNASFMVVFIPSIEQVSDSYYSDMLKAFPNSSIAKDAPMSIVISSGLDVVNMFEYLNESDYFPHDLHLNKLGHQKVANALMAPVQRELSIS